MTPLGAKRRQLVLIHYIPRLYPFLTYNFNLKTIATQEQLVKLKKIRKDFEFSEWEEKKKKKAAKIGLKKCRKNKYELVNLND